MAAVIRFGVQNHCTGLSRDPMNTCDFWSGQRATVKSGKASRSMCVRAGSSYLKRTALRVYCSKVVPSIVEKDELVRQGTNGSASDLSIVMKFGGSSVATADRMKEVADLILSFPEERPVIVLSAMGKTTNNLLMAGEKAVTCGVSNASDITELKIVKQLHLKTVHELGIDGSVISGTSNKNKRDGKSNLQESIFKK